MSNILDALRKAQDEKSRILGQSSSGCEGLLTNRPVRNRRTLDKRVIILAGSGVLLLSIVAWWLYGPSKPVSAPQIADMAGVPQAPGVSVPSASNSAPPPSPLLPAAPTQPNPAKAAPQGTQLAPPQIAAVHHGTESRQNLRTSEGTPNSPERPASTQTTASTTVSSAPEGVKLTGIAWQDSRKMRRAVINDLLVGEGAVVAGAKVLEIRPGLVRFEKNGTLFEALLPR